MPSKQFRINDTGSTLGLRWQWGYKHTQLRYNGELFGSVANKAELQQGRTFALPEHGLLGIQLVGRLTPRLSLQLNGTELESSPAHPKNVLSQAAYTLYFLGGLAVLVGLLAEVLAMNTLSALGYGWPTALYGSCLAVLGVGVAKGRAWAVWLSIGLLLLDLAAAFYFAGQTEGGSFSTAGLLIRMGVVYQLYEASLAVRELRVKELSRQPA